MDLRSHHRWYSRLAERRAVYSWGTRWAKPCPLSFASDSLSCDLTAVVHLARCEREHGSHRTALEPGLTCHGKLGDILGDISPVRGRKRRQRTVDSGRSAGIAPRSKHNGIKSLSPIPRRGPWKQKSEGATPCLPANTSRPKLKSIVISDLRTRLGP